MRVACAAMGVRLSSISHAIVCEEHKGKAPGKRLDVGDACTVCLFLRTST